ncbi:predicted protein [Nematostella vectensis]|uniref:Uncharacterized protein n=1 Tax=Nematostella vectensis TaxID=45351 RepID=A7S9A1_NEMVE|nr:predicted protein [Nematostella vectensis]|eukprot:XP_001631809.1 predicted protein [Nematostella vectensis]
MASILDTEVVLRISRGRSGLDAKNKTDSGCFVDDWDKTHAEKSPNASETGNTEIRETNSRKHSADSEDENGERCKKELTCSTEEASNREGSRTVYEEIRELTQDVSAMDKNNSSSLQQNDSIRSLEGEGTVENDAPKEDFYCLYYSDSPQGSLKRNAENNYQSDSTARTQLSDSNKATSSETDVVLRNARTDETDVVETKKKPPPVAPKPKKRPNRQSDSILYARDPLLAELQKLGASLGKDYAEVYAKQAEEKEMKKSRRKSDSSLLNCKACELEESGSVDVLPTQAALSEDFPERKSKIHKPVTPKKEVSKDKVKQTRGVSPKRTGVKNVGATKSTHLSKGVTGDSHRRSHMNTNSPYAPPTPKETPRTRKLSPGRTDKTSSKKDTKTVNPAKEKSAPKDDLKNQNTSISDSSQVQSSNVTKRSDRNEFRSSRKRLSGDLSSIPEHGIMADVYGNKTKGEISSEVIPLAGKEDDDDLVVDDEGSLKEGIIEKASATAKPENYIADICQSNEIVDNSLGNTVDSERITGDKRTGNDSKETQSASSAVYRTRTSIFEDDTQEVADNTDGAFDLTENSELYQDPEDLVDMTFGSQIDQTPKPCFKSPHKGDSGQPRRKLNQGQLSHPLFYEQQFDDDDVDASLDSNSPYLDGSFETRDAITDVSMETMTDVDRVLTRPPLTRGAALNPNSNVHRFEFIESEGDQLQGIHQGTSFSPEAEDMLYLDPFQAAPKKEVPSTSSVHDQLPDPSGFMTVEDIKRLLFEKTEDSLEQLPSRRPGSYAGMSNGAFRNQPRKPESVKRRSWAGHEVKLQPKRPGSLLVKAVSQNLPSKASEQPEKSPFVRTVSQPLQVSHDYYSDSFLDSISEGKERVIGRSSSFNGRTPRRASSVDSPRNSRSRLLNASSSYERRTQEAGLNRASDRRVRSLDRNEMVSPPELIQLLKDQPAALGRSHSLSEKHEQQRSSCLAKDNKVSVHELTQLLKQQGRFVELAQSECSSDRSQEQLISVPEVTHLLKQQKQASKSGRLQSFSTSRHLQRDRSGDSGYHDDRITVPELARLLEKQRRVVEEETIARQLANQQQQSASDNTISVAELARLLREHKSSQKGDELAYSRDHYKHRSDSETSISIPELTRLLKHQQYQQPIGATRVHSFSGAHPSRRGLAEFRHIYRKPPRNYEPRSNASGESSTSEYSTTESERTFPRNSTRGRVPRRSNGSSERSYASREDRLRPLHDYLESGQDFYRTSEQPYQFQDSPYVQLSYREESDLYSDVQSEGNSDIDHPSSVVKTVDITKVLVQENGPRRPTLSERFANIRQNMSDIDPNPKDSDGEESSIDGSNVIDPEPELEFDDGDYTDDKTMLVAEALRVKKVLGNVLLQQPELDTLVAVATFPAPSLDDEVDGTSEPIEDSRTLDQNFKALDQSSRPNESVENNIPVIDTGSGTVGSKSSSSEKVMSANELLELLVNLSRTDLAKAEVKPQDPDVVVQNLFFPAPQTKAASTGNIHAQKTFPGHVNQLYGNPDGNSVSQSQSGRQKLPRSSLTTQSHDRLEQMRYKTQEEDIRCRDVLGLKRAKTIDVVQAQLVSTSEDGLHRQSSLPSRPENIFEEEVDCMRTRRLLKVHTGSSDISASGSSLDEDGERREGRVSSVSYIGYEKTEKIETLPRGELAAQKKRVKNRLAQYVMNKKEGSSKEGEKGEPEVTQEKQDDYEIPPETTITKSQSKATEEMEARNDAEKSKTEKPPKRIGLKIRVKVQRDISKSLASDSCYVTGSSGNSSGGNTVIDKNVTHHSPVISNVKEMTLSSNVTQQRRFSNDVAPSPNSVNMFIDYKKNVRQVTSSTPKADGKPEISLLHGISPVATTNEFPDRNRTPSDLDNNTPSSRNVPDNGASLMTGNAERSNCSRSPTRQVDRSPNSRPGSAAERSSSTYSSDDDRFDEVFGSTDTVVFVGQSKEGNDAPTSPACISSSPGGTRESMTEEEFNSRVDEIVQEVKASMGSDSEDLLDQALERVKNRLSPGSRSKAPGGLTMEAYVALHQADELQSIINEIKGELRLLKEENKVLRSQVDGLAHDKTGEVRSVAETSVDAGSTGSADSKRGCVSATPPTHEKVFVVLIFYIPFHFLVSYDEMISVDVFLRGFGKSVGIRHPKKSDVMLGTVLVKGGSDWAGVYDAAKKSFSEHLKLVDPYSYLGLSSSSLHGVETGAVMWTPDTIRRHTPRVEISRKHNSCILHLKDTIRRHTPRVEISRKHNSCILHLKDGTNESCDSLVYNTLLPRKVIEDFLYQVLEHRYVILCGPVGLGKSFLASKLAEHLAERLNWRASPSVITLTVGQTSRRDLKKTLARLMSCDIYSRAEGVPAVIVLDQLNCLASLADIFEPAQLADNSNSDDEELLLDLFVWLTEVWHHINRILEDYCSLDVTLGPSLFYSCPMDFHSAEGWFGNVWNYQVIPYLHQTIRNSSKLVTSLKRGAQLEIAGSLESWTTAEFQSESDSDRESAVHCPSLFYSCPMDFHSAEGWFGNVWNYQVIPYLHQTIRNSSKIYERNIVWDDPTKWVIMRWPWQLDRSKVLPTLRKLRQVDIVLNRNHVESPGDQTKSPKAKSKKLVTSLKRGAQLEIAGSLESWTTAEFQSESDSDRESAVHCTL